MKRRRNTTAMLDAEAEAYELLMTRGLLAATNALIAVCEDPKGTAQAKATAGRTIIEATGMLKKDPLNADKSVSDMTPDELRAKIAKVDLLIEEGAALESDLDQDGSVFG